MPDPRKEISDSSRLSGESSPYKATAGRLQPEPIDWTVTLPPGTTIKVPQECGFDMEVTFFYGATVTPKTARDRQPLPLPDEPDVAIPDPQETHD